MYVSDIKLGNIQIVDLERVDREPFDFDWGRVRKEELHLHRGASEDEFLLRRGDQAWAVRGVNGSHQLALADVVGQQRPHLAWLVSTLPQKSATPSTLTVQIHEFPMRAVISQPLDLALTDDMADELRGRFLKQSDTEEAVLEWLRNRLLLPPGRAEGPVRALLSTVTGAQKFRIYGRDVALDVQRRPDERLVIVRVVQSVSGRSEKHPVSLAEGNIRFCDLTQAGKARADARALLNTSSAYLDLWEAYNRAEWERTLTKARRFGWLRYASRQMLPDGNWRFQLAPGEDAADAMAFVREEGEAEVTAATSVPEELQQADGAMLPRTAQSTVKFGGLIRHYSPGFQTLDLQPSDLDDETQPPVQGYLYLSTHGDRMRTRRREEARERIRLSENLLTSLGPLLEGHFMPAVARNTHPALSKSALAAFAGAPTQAQEEALRVALNTPDVALIQGPPGTGKTRTIAALQIRLAELAGKYGGIAGTTLVTSDQHDAVANVASRSIVFGLPALKVGKRRKGGEDDGEGLERWRRDRVERVRAQLAQYPEPPISAMLRRIKSQLDAYRTLPSTPQHAAALLKEVAGWIRGRVPGALTEELLHQADSLARGGDFAEDFEERQLAETAVRSLRLTPGAFSDDGPMRTLAALRRLTPMGLLQADDVALLEVAASWLDDQDLSFLPALEALQGRLLDRLMVPDLPVHNGVPNPEVLVLLERTCQALRQALQTSPEGIEGVLSRYLDELENDHLGVRDTIRHYTSVLAATCQQSVGKAMDDVKRDGIVFDNVIVDEAAHANPLDLLIPLSRARRRVVLVGDHRQLPHVLEPDLENEVTTSYEEMAKEGLRKSLFEILFERLKRWQAEDGIVRTVTLDTQYRMHPALGDFVSRTFYESKGDPTIASGRSHDDFAHNLPGYEGAVAAWLDVPRSTGAEQPGKSKSRVAEARVVARELKRLMAADHDRRFTFGVITFYAAQREALWRAFEAESLVTAREEGGYAWVGPYSETQDGHRRVQVGTVDAFQGKEFDVVLLSMVRSNQLPEGEEAAMRKRYGHLMLENRLCVAMSRQMRLLVGVGDMSMIQSEAAARFVPGLVAFKELCKTHGKIHQA